MKKIIVMLSLGVMVAGASFAQNAPQKEKKNRTEYRADREHKKHNRNPEARAQKQTERMAQRLNLNKSQQKKLQALNVQHAKDMQALQAKYKDADRANSNMRDERKALHAKREAEMKSILNKKQYAQYEAEKSQMRARRQERGQERGKDFKGKESRRSQSS
ncbi:DUF4890 domain-containing protein [Pontibacter beigongshangensis]|uniref:DUF4890 domain-containing protein n=1 Tax=Pontibacter beigongshangensis TaxID=2574733 RepID=UPI001650B541|nr:DUF4890 domain-containing protein [Pontibacter beigongshangensis]